MTSHIRDQEEELTPRTKSATMKRAERRNIVPMDLAALMVQIRRDYERAKDRYESLRVVLETHTLWQHEDGRDICDHDGESWPCSFVVGLAFVYDYPIRENWERPS